MAGANVLVFKGRAPEKGATTEARPLRRYARAADCERVGAGRRSRFANVGAQETAVASFAKGTKTAAQKGALIDDAAGQEGPACGAAGCRARCRGTRTGRR